MSAEKPRPPSPVHDLPTPQNVRAERACLALILGVRATPKAAQVRASLLDRLAEDWFSSNARRSIFLVCRKLVAEGHTPGLAEVYEQFGEAERVARIDQELIACYRDDEIPALEDADWWAAKVADAAARRMISDQAMLVRTEIAAGADTSEVLAESARAIEAAQLVASGYGSSDASTAAEATQELLDQLEAAQRGESVGIPTGLADLDEKIGGLRAPDLIVIAARPSMGKSALAAWMACEVAQNGHRVAIVSLEMSKVEIHVRLLASMAGIPLHKLRSGEFSNDHWDEINRACPELHSLPICYLDKGPLDLHSIRGKLRRLHQDKPLRLVVVDYLQIVPSGSRQENRNQEVAYLSREFKGLARDLGVPLILVSQLSRATEGRAEHRPRLTDLRESGAIEQDADIVLLLHRQDYYDENCPEDRRGILEINVAKQRQGPTGIVEVAFRRSHLSFHNLAREPTRNGYRADTEEP